MGGHAVKWLLILDNIADPQAFVRERNESPIVDCLAMKDPPVFSVRRTSSHFFQIVIISALDGVDSGDVA